MSLILNVTFLMTIIFLVNSASSSPTPEEDGDKPNQDASDSAEEESNDKELDTISPTEMEKLKEEIIENQEENAEKYGLPLTSSPEEVDAFLDKEEKEYGKELPDKIEGDLKESDDEFKNFVHFLAFFDKIETEASGEDEEEVEKSDEEMKEMKAETFKLLNELNERKGLSKVSHEKYDKVWNQQKEKYGKQFPGKVVKVIELLKESEEKEEATPSGKEESESSTESATQENDISVGKLPTDAFFLRNAKGKICILAKFHSAITIAFPGKTSEQKVEVSIPSTSNVKGKCAGPDRSPSLHISWGKFIFSLHFNKTSGESWGVTLVELTYDTSEPLFDGAVTTAKVVAKSEKVVLFETPFEKSYFCPGQEVIKLYSEEIHVATVHLKEIHLQPYDVEDGKFSPSHRCNQVVIGGPDQEPFVQDETVPLAVGLTLALITLLILVGFAVHRAYNAAKVDYNSVE